MSVDKELMVATNVSGVNLDTKELTLRLKYPSYLSEASQTADDLLKKLIKQHTDFFTKTPIRGLTLKWSDYTDDIEEGNV